MLELVRRAVFFTSLHYIEEPEAVLLFSTASTLLALI